MSLGEHLEELRRRVIIALLGLVPIIVLAFVFGKPLLDVITKPVTDALRAHGEAGQMILTGPAEGFAVYMKVAILAAVVVGAPWLIYQLWKFVSPGLYSHEKRFAYFLIPLSTILTASGVAFLYFYIMPLILTFFLDFNSALGASEIAVAPLPPGTTLANMPLLAADPPADALQPGSAWINTSQNLLRICVAVKDSVPTIASVSLKASVGAVSEFRYSEYFSLLLSLTIAFAVAFQAPVVVLLLGWAGLVDQKTLGKYRRHAILVCAIVAAAITPGDPASMIMLLVPLYLLYELGGILLRLFPAKRVAGKRTGSRWGSSEEEYEDDLVEGPR
ncbi:MAG TPA: twin-arginine translocase subunit TatC [Phycisphaerales bacterium]|nr:twin-arginine translocase subunit TatC [Phycisphaerales bacterium]